MKFLLTYHEDAQASMPASTYSYLAQSGMFNIHLLLFNLCLLVLGMPNFVERLHFAAKKLPRCKNIFVVLYLI